MDENLSRGYVQLNRQQRGPERDHDAPRDNYHLVYLGLVLAGIGFLVPYNSFIIACDYFQVSSRGFPPLEASEDERYRWKRKKVQKRSNPRRAYSETA